jgi:hypothetical protein
MTPMRDMRISGPALQKAHGSVGWYLATTFLPKLVGLEEVLIPHVRGNQTTGHCYLRHEKQTAIVAGVSRWRWVLTKRYFSLLPSFSFFAFTNLNH